MSTHILLLRYASIPIIIIIIIMHIARIWVIYGCILLVLIKTCKLICVRYERIILSAQDLLIKVYNMFVASHIIMHIPFIGEVIMVYPNYERARRSVA